jgi:hypothetical protein
LPSLPLLGFHIDLAVFIQQRVHFKHCVLLSIMNWNGWKRYFRRLWTFWQRMVRIKSAMSKSGSLGE